MTKDPEATTEEYREVHRCCPECGSDDFYQTTAAWPGKIDRNAAVCQSCKWSGIIHDRVPAKPDRSKLLAEYKIRANHGFAFYQVLYRGRIIGLFYWWNDEGEELAHQRAERFVQAEVEHRTKR